MWYIENNRKRNSGYFCGKLETICLLHGLKVYRIRKNPIPVTSVYGLCIAILSPAPCEERDVRFFSSYGAKNKMVIHSPYTEVTRPGFVRLSGCVVPYEETTYGVINLHIYSSTTQEKNATTSPPKFLFSARPASKLFNCNRSIIFCSLFL